MITERNMVFANPQAYRVFPNIGNPMNTGITEQAVYQGYLQVTDSTGKTQSFTDISTIDFTGFSGYVDIDQYSDVGSVKLGRWNIISTTPVEPTLPGQKTFAESTAADYVLYDKVNDKKICVEYGTDLSNYSSEQYTPIGVVVVPGTHDVYGDGSCGVMSLKPMNCNTPSTGGTSEQHMYWGVYGTNISGLPDLNQVPTGNTLNGIPIGRDSNGYLPSDKSSNTQCAHDTDAYYNFGPYIPSPYLTDGSRNPGYYQTSSPSSSSNSLADFDGIGNTEKIITQRGAKDYNSWTPAPNSEADYPAASCCDMFHTEGTQQGDWYLPAMGELGYIMPPFNKINDTISKMITEYGSSVGVELDTNGNYWSSTEYGSRDARRMSTQNGYVGSIGKGAVDVRAFLRVADDTQEQPTEEYEYVDLGLPSGLLWAKKNIGAETEEDAGLYFQWGDTQGYTAEQVGTGEGKKYFGWDDYKFSVDGSSTDFSKYNETDGKTVLDLEDDAAHVNIGGNWRMPTSDDFVELCQNTDLYLVPTEGEEVKGNITENDVFPLYFKWENNLSNVDGMKFYKKGDRGTYLFLPATGHISNGSARKVGEYGHAQASSLSSLGVQYAGVLNFYSSYGVVYSANRFTGYPIRAVKSNN